MSKPKVLLIVFAWLWIVSAVARADIVLYNNGAPNQQDGNEMTEWLQSEDFTLSQTSQITSWTFWDLELPQSGYQGSIQWWITGDLNGKPNFNNIVANGVSSGNDVVRTQTNGGLCNIFGYCEYMDTVSPAAMFGDVAPGTYHLVLHNGPVSFDQRSEFYWETTNANNTPPGLECDLQRFGSGCYTGDGSRYSSNGEHAFYISGNAVPEPGSLVLMGTGILSGLVAIRRRIL